MRDLLLEECLYKLSLMTPQQRWRAMWQMNLMALGAAWRRQDWRVMSTTLLELPGHLIRGLILLFCP